MKDETRKELIGYIDQLRDRLGEAKAMSPAGKPVNVWERMADLIRECPRTEDVYTRCYFSQADLQLARDSTGYRDFMKKELLASFGNNVADLYKDSIKETPEEGRAFPGNFELRAEIVIPRKRYWTPREDREARMAKRACVEAANASREGEKK